MKILFLLFLLCYFYRKNNIKIYEWHCKNIYPFDKKLTKIEKEYIFSCINVSFLELFKKIYFIDPFIQKLSYFTFSHNCKNNDINSSRIAYGSTMCHNYVYKYAINVLRERNIKCEIEPGYNYNFGGLGWDIQNDIFKIYFRFINHRDLKDEYKKLVPSTNIEDSGILSISYNNGKIVEKKIYTYPKDKWYTILKSDKRQDIQIDTDDIKWESKLNHIGSSIVEKYKKDKYKLDTITFKDKMNYTLYFPRC